MPSTARLLTAVGDNAIHAHRPAEDHTLCGLLTVVEPEAWADSGTPPSRSADYTGRRFYTGVYRLMCQRCVGEANKARHGHLGVPLEDVR